MTEIIKKTSMMNDQQDNPILVKLVFMMNNLLGNNHSMVTVMKVDLNDNWTILKRNQLERHKKQMILMSVLLGDSRKIIILMNSNLKHKNNTMILMIVQLENNKNKILMILMKDLLENSNNKRIKMTLTKDLSVSLNLTSIILTNYLLGNNLIKCQMIKMKGLSVDSKVRNKDIMNSMNVLWENNNKILKMNSMNVL